MKNFRGVPEIFENGKNLVILYSDEKDYAKTIISN
jgi:hypothetical protein